MAEKKEVEHIGTKTLALAFGIVLAAIYALLKFITTPTLNAETLSNIAIVTVFFAFIWTLILFLAQIFWRWMHAISERIG
jgi:uncharacterized protein YqhQ